MTRRGQQSAARRNRHHGAADNGPLSILHVVAPARFGGLESVLRALAAGHKRRGHNVRVALVLSPEDREHPFADALEREGLDPARIYVGNRDYRSERRAVRDLCRAAHFDVFHTHGFRPDVVDGSVARSERIPTVSTCHGFIESSFRARLYQWLDRRALRRFDAVVAVSAPIADRVRAAGVAPAKVHLVQNAFAPPSVRVAREDARRRLGVRDGFIIGWVGRISAEKGPDLAIEALSLLRHPGARLVIIGSGPDEESLRDRASALGVGDKIVWRGVIPDAGILFGGFDAFLLSSRTEGTPVALLEAMAAGVPIVATRVGGVPDMIDGSSAHIVESFDVEAMAKALAHIIADPSDSRVLAVRALARLDRDFSLDRWLSRYESIYRMVSRPRMSGAAARIAR